MGLTTVSHVDRRQQLLEYLRDQHVMSIATMSADGPWAAAVFYVNQLLSFYFLSAPDTRHCLDIGVNAHVASTIAGDVADWRAIKGVQMAAHARELLGEERELARRLYAAKFPLVTTLSSVPSKIAEAFEKIRWYELRATRIRFIDNSLGFGHKDEWSAAEFFA